MNTVQVWLKNNYANIFSFTFRLLKLMFIILQVWLLNKLPQTGDNLKNKYPWVCFPFFSSYSQLLGIYSPIPFHLPVFKKVKHCGPLSCLKGLKKRELLAWGIQSSQLCLMMHIHGLAFIAPEYRAASLCLLQDRQILKFCTVRNRQKLGLVGVYCF